MNFGKELFALSLTEVCLEPGGGGGGGIMLKVNDYAKDAEDLTVFYQNILLNLLAPLRESE